VLAGLVDAQERARSRQQVLRLHRLLTAAPTAHGAGAGGEDVLLPGRAVPPPLRLSPTLLGPDCGDFRVPVGRNLRVATPAGPGWTAEPGPNPSHHQVKPERIKCH